MFVATSADARTAGKPLNYPRDHVWATAVRFVAVDEHAKILDKDVDAGYVLFEFTDRDKTYRGSLEVTTVATEDTSGIRFVINLVDRPSWMELAMLTRLEAKLRAELGSPNPAKPKPQEPPKDNDPPAKDKDPDKDKHS